MKTVEKIKLKLAYGIDDGEKSVNKSKTFASVSTQATDEDLKTVGDAILTLVDGSNKNVYRIEESLLG